MARHPKVKSLTPTVSPKFRKKEYDQGHFSLRVSTIKSTFSPLIRPLFFLLCIFGLHIYSPSKRNGSRCYDFVSYVGIFFFLAYLFSGIASLYSLMKDLTIVVQAYGLFSGISTLFFILSLIVFQSLGNIIYFGVFAGKIKRLTEKLNELFLYNLRSLRITLFLGIGFHILILGFALSILLVLLCVYSIPGGETKLQILAESYSIVVAFGTLICPALFYACFCIYLSAAFKQNLEKFKTSESLDVSELELFRKGYIRLTSIANQADFSFSYLFLFNTSLCSIGFCFVIYFYIKGDMRDIAFSGTEMMFTIHGYLCLSATVWIACFFGYNLFAVYLNEKIDRFIQKTQDREWGLTFGRFFLVERGSILTLMSLIFTVMVLWIQLGQNSDQVPLHPRNNETA